MSYDLYLVHLPKGLTVNSRHSMTKTQKNSGRKDSRRTNNDRLGPDYPPMELATLYLKLKFQFYQTIMVACSTLLGVLIALLPSEFQPTEGRTLYLYCCFALALCTLLSGIVLYVLLMYPDSLEAYPLSERSSPKDRKPDIELIRLRVKETTLKLLLFYFLMVSFLILFLFLFLMLFPDSQFLLKVAPEMPYVVLYLSIVSIFAVFVRLIYLLGAPGKDKAQKSSSLHSSAR